MILNEMIQKNKFLLRFGWLISIVSFFLPALGQNFPADSAVFLSPNPKKSSGFYCVSSISLNGFNNPLINGIKSSAGFSFNPVLAVGAGVGIERFVQMKMYDTLNAGVSSKF
jgi:hypothetical protein